MGLGKRVKNAFVIALAAFLLLAVLAAIGVRIAEGFFSIMGFSTIFFFALIAHMVVDF